MNMDFGTNKTSVIKEVSLEEFILETNILELMINGIQNHGKNLIS